MAYRLDGHEYEQAPGDRVGQGSLASYGPWGSKESDMTERLNNKKQLIKPKNHNSNRGGFEDSQSSPKWIPGVVTPVSPEALLDMQILRLTLDPVNRKSSGWRPAFCVLANL